MNRTYAPRDTTHKLYEPATPAQLNFLNSLRNERGLGPYDGPDLTKRAASAEIDEVKAMPRPRPEASTAKLQAGVYRAANGTLYRVYPARQHDGMLAKRVLTEGGFEYAGAAARFVKPDQRLTVEEAAAWGQEYGVCCVCGALLTDPDSVAAGIGPICAGKY